MESSFSSCFFLPATADYPKTESYHTGKRRQVCSNRGSRMRYDSRKHLQVVVRAITGSKSPLTHCDTCQCKLSCFLCLCYAHIQQKSIANLWIYVGVQACKLNMDCLATKTLPKIHVHLYKDGCHQKLGPVIVSSWCFPPGMWFLISIINTACLLLSDTMENNVAMPVQSRYPGDSIEHPITDSPSQAFVYDGLSVIDCSIDSLYCLDNIHVLTSLHYFLLLFQQNYVQRIARLLVQVHNDDQSDDVFVMLIHIL